MQPIDENRIIEKIKSGDAHAFDDLVRSFQSKVYNMVYRMFNNENDALDISQETFIRVYKAIGSFKFESSLSTWIYRITYNTCIDEIRKRKLVSQSFDDFDEDHYSTSRLGVGEYFEPAKALDKKLLKEELMSAIDSLSHNQKTVILLRDIEGLPYRDISEIIGCDVGAVKSRISRARSSLKKYLIENTQLFAV